MENIFKNYLAEHNYSHFDLKAILFDMDGVLYDSMKFHARSWKQTMDENGINSTPEEFYLYEGQVGRNTINSLVIREKGREATPEEKERMYKRKTELFSLYNDGGLIPFAYEFVSKIKNEGLTPVIVTGSGQPTLIDKLDDNFHGLFRKELMVTAFDVKFGKPHPEPYLMGMHKAGNLNANQVIVVENAPLGVEAAVAVGIFTIAINTGPLPDKVLADAGANIVLPSMESLYNNWEQIYEIIERI